MTTQTEQRPGTQRHDHNQPVRMNESVEAQSISPASGEVGDVDSRVAATTTKATTDHKSY